MNSRTEKELKRKQFSSIFEKSLAVENQCEITWTSAFHQAAKLVLLDFLWGIPLTLAGLVIVAQELQFSRHTWCRLLKSASGSETITSLPNFTLAVEIIVTALLYVVPVMTCVLLVEKDYKDILKKWWKVWKVSGFFLVVDFVYRVVMYFIYIHPIPNREIIGYPSNYSIISHLIWAIGAMASINKACGIWATKHTTHLVIQHKLPQSEINYESKKVKKFLRNRISGALLCSVFCGTALRSYMKTLSIGDESNRALLIIIVICLSYPLWLFTDQIGRSSLPWSSQIKSILYDDSTENKASLTYSFDIMERNGFLLSMIPISGMTILVRGLQANMSSLRTKIFAGIVASVISSLLTLVEPHILDGFRRIVRLKSKWYFGSSKRVAPKNNHNLGESRESKAQRLKKVYTWHRAHMIIALNRLELFSILFGNSVVLLSIYVRSSALEREQNAINSDSPPKECDVVDQYTIVVLQAFTLCLLELLVEILTYTYMIKVEKLPLFRIVKRKRFNISLFMSVISIILFVIGELLTVAIAVLSCNEIPEYLYFYQCVS